MREARASIGQHRWLVMLYFSQYFNLYGTNKKSAYHSLPLKKARTFGLTGVWVPCDLEKIVSVIIVENKKGMIFATIYFDVTTQPQLLAI